MKFGTSGVRGLAAEMTDAACARYTAAFLRHLGGATAVPAALLVARDLRPSSPRIAAACLRAASSLGVAAVDCGLLPTPALALEALRRRLPAIMVTGSHIPFDRNGLKFYRPDGEITKLDEAGIRDALADVPPPGPSGAPALSTSEDAAARYVARYVDFFGAGRLRGRRVGVYQHSAAGRDLLSGTLRRLGAEVVEIGRTDRFVPIDTEAIAPADAARFRDWVRAHALDALVSTDGDGDRPILVDEAGTMLRGDAVGALTARALAAAAVATPLSSSTAAERSAWFGAVRRTRIGSPYVIEAIAALRAEGMEPVAGYEANGGFILGSDAVGDDGRRMAALPTRDAMTPIVALLAASAQGTLSALAATLPPRTTASARLAEVPAGLSARLLATLAADPVARAGLLEGVAAPPVSVDTQDGVRMTLASGEIAHLRASGNAPELRCYGEADSQPRADRLVHDLLARVGTLLGRPPSRPASSGASTGCPRED